MRIGVVRPATLAVLEADGAVRRDDTDAVRYLMACPLACSASPRMRQHRASPLERCAVSAPLTDRQESLGVEAVSP